MKKFFVLVFVLLMPIAGFAFGRDEHVSLIRDGDKAGWRIFGYGVQDSAADANTKEIVIDVSWDQATWGVGGYYMLDKPINGKKLKAIRIQAKTQNGSKAGAFAGISTKDDANLVFGIDKAIELSNSWMEVVFPISEMRKERPDVTSKIFVENDWEKIQMIKILFAKPKNGKIIADRVLVKNPELIFD